MGIWKMDRNTALKLCDLSEKIPKSEKNVRFYFEECEKCGASYFKELGHKCEDTIELQTRDLTKEEQEEFDCDVVEVQ